MLQNVLCYERIVGSCGSLQSWQVRFT